MFVYYALFLILSWPVRTLSFSHDGEMLASGSEDLIIDIVCITYLVGNNLKGCTHVCHNHCRNKVLCQNTSLFVDPGDVKAKHRMPKWLAISYSFIFVLISLASLLNMRKIRKNLHTKMRRVSLISICMTE